MRARMKMVDRDIEWMGLNIFKVKETQESTDRLDTRDKKTDKKAGIQVSSLISCMVPLIEMG